MKKYVDMENWSRKKQFELFNSLDYPHFSITANVDITKMYAYIKENELPFYNTMVYLTIKTANSIKEFRCRISGNKVVEYDVIHPSFTISSKDDLFSFCTTVYKEDYDEFLKFAKMEINRLGGEVDLEDEVGKDDLIFITSVPWVSFTSVTHPIHMNPVDSIPRIAWGKYFNDNGKIKMPLSIQGHHGLMDGLHVGKYFNKLQEFLDSPKNSIK